MDKWLEYFGYAASMVVLISLLMTSIKKLRWINLIGAIMFGAYGFLINSIPTGFMNLGIAVIDIYFLVKMYSNKDYFKLLGVEQNSDYFNSFLEFYKEDIGKFQDIDLSESTDAEVKLFTLRNMNPAGLFIGKKYKKDTLEILLDYAIPQYRDFKLGDYVFTDQASYFKDKGYTKLLTFSDKEEHMKYLEKMGFTSSNIDGKLAYIKEL